MKRAVLSPPFTDSAPASVTEPGRRVTFEGVDVFLRETPATRADAEPALYVHGLGGSSSNWTDLAGLLGGHVAGQAVDLPGSGRSGPARSYTIGAMADWVARWIEHTGRGPVHLFGNSLGGAITVKVAGSRPDLIRSLTLISPAMPFLNPRRSRQGPMVPLVFLPRAARLIGWRMAAMTPADLAQMVVESCFADPSLIPDERMREHIEEAELRNTVPWYWDAYVRSLRGLISTFVRAYLPGPGSLWRTAARITAPTLVIAGRQDRLVDVRVAPQVARVVPDARLLMLANIGHVAQIETPSVVARAFLGMLAEIRSTETPLGAESRRADMAS
jgi:pimeloyl-ACP methyl ester carboxylesterase